MSEHTKIPKRNQNSKEVWRRIIASSVEQLRKLFEERSHILGCTMLPVVPDLILDGQELKGNVLYRNEWGWSILKSLAQCSSAAMVEGGDMAVAMVEGDMAAAMVERGDDMDMAFVVDVLLPILREAAGLEDPDGFESLDIEATAATSSERRAAAAGKRKRPMIGTAPAAVPTSAAAAVAASAAAPSAVAAALPDASSATPPASSAATVPAAKAARFSAPAATAACATQLRDAGWCVLPIFPASEVPAIRRAFWRAVASFPEYQTHVRSKDLPAALEQHFVQGGFGALGNPASFHHPAVRRCRTRRTTSANLC